MKTRLLAALLCLCLLLTALPSAALAEETTTGTVYGLDPGSPLRVRNAPVDGDTIGQLYNGDVVTILSTSEDGGWYQVLTASGITGWSSATYIRINSNKPPALPDGVTGTVVDIDPDSKLYVWEKADKTGEILEKLSNGVVVAVLSQSADGKVYQITTPSGVTGWCTAQYVRINISYETNEEFEAYLTAQGFPEDYKPALRQLYARYPNWVFQAAVLPMTFAEAVEAESEVLKNSLNVYQHPESWLSMEYGAYNWSTGSYVEMDSGGWVTPTPEITAYYMDPRNWLEDRYLFQFETLFYSANHTVAGVREILPAKYDDYAADVVSAAKDSNVSAYFLATRMAQEGTKIDGTWVDPDGVSYKGYYNFFNYGAYAGSQHGAYHGAVTNGAIYAKKQGWDSPYKCLVGSAKKIGDSYVFANQHTIYYQKFNVEGTNLYNHQYMSNINAPSSESVIRYTRTLPNELQNPIVFRIPVYKEMPETVSPKPSEQGNNNNFLDSLTVDGFKLTPSFNRYTMEYAVLVNKDTTHVTISAKQNNKDATVTGVGKIQLYAGENLLPITVTATSGQTRTYTVSVFCEADDAPEKPDEPDQPVTPPTPPATPTPTVTSKTYRIGDKVTGVEPNTAVKDFTTKLTVTDGTAKVYTADGKEKAEGTIATGDTLKVADKDGKVCITLPILIYGDVNGDGKISTIDLRIIRKHLLDVTPITGLSLAAADVNGDGKPSTIDLRMMRKYILGLTTSLQAATGGNA